MGYKLAFYSALHLVEASFARDGNHFDSHTSRNNHFKHERSLQNIWRHYKPLYDHSLKALYLTDDEGSAESLIKKHLGAKGVSEKVLGHHLRQVEKSVATILQKASIFDSDISESIAMRRRMAGWNIEYLAQVLGISSI